MELVKIGFGSICMVQHRDAIVLDEMKQREIIRWLWKEKPEMIREIVCDGCPEIC